MLHGTYKINKLPIEVPWWLIDKFTCVVSHW